MTVPYFKVIRVMRWSDFYNPCSEILLNVFVSDDWNFTVNKWQDYCFPDKRLVTFVVWVNRNSCISKKCFWTSCCDF